MQPKNTRDIFYSAFTYSAIGMALVSLEGDWLDVNDSLCKMLGYDKSELISLNFRDITHPADVEKGNTYLQQILRKEIDTYQIEKRYITKSQTVMHAFVSVSVVLDENKFPNFFISQIQDLTATKAVEAALKESEERWLFAIESSREGVWDWNTQTNKVFFSDRWKAMLGYEPAEIQNDLSEWEFRVHPDDKERRCKDLEKHFKSETPYYESIHRVKCKNGDYKWILDRGKIITRTEEELPLRIIGTHTDIHDQKIVQLQLNATNEELQKLNDYKNKVLSIIAHDLKSPLSSCLSTFEMIFSDYESFSEEEIKKLLLLLRERASLIYNLLEELLLWGKHQLGHIIFNPDYQSFSNILDCTLKVLSPAAQAKNIRFALTISKDDMVFADADMIKVILRNLASNAIKFSHADSTILISLENTECDSYIVLKDAGIGINSEITAKILNPTFHHSSFGTAGEKGSGLGLSICNELLKKHNSELYIDSKEGEGTVVSFRLPKTMQVGEEGIM